MLVARLNRKSQVTSFTNNVAPAVKDMPVCWDKLIIQSSVSDCYEIVFSRGESAFGKIVGLDFVFEVKNLTI